jgi:hypothetical protein
VDGGTLSGPPDGFITVENADGFIPSVMFPPEIVFFSRAYPSVRLSVGCFFYLRQN